MTKGSYSVGENNVSPSRKDTSYRSFICALLIFLFICLIILLASIGWGAGRSHQNGPTKPTTEQNQVEVLERKGSYQNGTHEKIVDYYETTTLLDRLINVIYKEVENQTEKEEKGTTVNSVISKHNAMSETEKVSTNIETKIESITEKENASTTTTNVPITTTKTVTEKAKSVETKVETSVESITEEENAPTNITNIPITTTKTVTEKAKSVETKVETTVESIIEEENALTTIINSPITTTKTVTEKTKSVKTTEEENAPSTITNSPITTTKTVTEKTKSVKENIGIKYENTTEAASEINSVTDIKKEETTAATDIIDDQNTTTEIDNTLSTQENEVNTDYQQIEQQLFITEYSNSTTTETTLNETSEEIQKSSTETTSSTSTTEVSIMESEAATEPIMLKMSSPLTKSSNPVCDSVVCKTTSSRILSMMNHSADPCDDFYEFACGRMYEIEEETVEFIDAKVIIDQMDLINDTSRKHLRDFKGFYLSCVRHEDYFNYRKRMNKLEDLLKEVGEFQFNNESSSVDLTDLVAQLLLRQSMPLFDIGLDVDKHTSNLILQLTLPHQSFLRTGLENWSGLSLLKKRCLKKQKSLIRGTHINLSEIYESYQRCHHNYASYLNSIEFLMRDLKAFTNIPEEILFTEVVATRQNIEFEILNNLDSLPSSAEILREFIIKKYEVRKLSDLKYHYPIFDWKKLFQTLTGGEVSDNTTIQIYFSNYFKNIFTSLARVDKKKLNNALLAIYAYDLFINTVVPKERFTREKFCTDLTKKLFPDVWSHVVQNTYPVKEQSRRNTQVGNIFGVLKKKLCSNLFEAEWIDDDTKPLILNKCNNLNLRFFEPADETSLVKNYDILNVTFDFQTNLINSLIHFKQTIYSKQGSPISVKKIFSYFLDPLGSKPLTFYSNQMIVAPLGIMAKAPEGLPNYLLMTRVGLTLSRQMARHFDPTGMTYKLKLKSSSKSTYFELVETMNNQMDYSSPRIFEGRNISFNLNGSLSVNERIVDNTAFRLISDSLSLNPDEDILPWISSQYSREKIFFIATAQEFCKKTTMLDFMLEVFERRHLPAALRVENIMGNSEDFADKFACPDGSGIDFYVKPQFPHLTKVEDEYEDDENFQSSR